MQRNMDLIREVLLAVESQCSGRAIFGVKVEHYSDEAVAYHTILLIDAGFVDGENHGIHGQPLNPLVRRLTWEGHEFLDAAREPTRWEQAKKVLGKAGGASFPVWVRVLTDLGIKAAGL
jgi:hypothetical protein